MITPAKHFAAFAAAVALVAAPVASAKTTIRVQSVIPTKADEVTMLRDYADNVRALTQGEVDIEVLPAGAVVGVKETLDAVDKGLIEGGFAWTHYWSGKHPAATLFGSPTAGAGLGMDNIAWVSWYMFGGGKELYDRLWDEMGVNVKGLMLQPVGPEALGWFKEPINSLDDFRKYRYRAPPGIPGETYNEIGVAAVAMGGGDILPGARKRHDRRRRMVLPQARFGFRLPESAEALLSARVASGRRQRRYVYQPRCLEFDLARAPKSDGSRRRRLAHARDGLPHL